jgi:hypothetical protein
MQLKSCTVTNFGLKDSLYRDTAPVPIYWFSTPRQFPATLKTWTATAPVFNITCTMTAKSAPPSRYARRGTAYPPCTPAAHCVRAGRGVIALWLKYQYLDRMLRRVTQPPHIAGPLPASPSQIFSRNLEIHVANLLFKPLTILYLNLPNDYESK